MVFGKHSRWGTMAYNPVPPDTTQRSSLLERYYKSLRIVAALPSLENKAERKEGL
jgi:hypothetical protein